MSAITNPSVTDSSVDQPTSDRWWYIGLAISATIHVGLILSLGALQTAGGKTETVTLLHTAWDTDESSFKEPTIIPLTPKETVTDNQSATNSLAGATARQLTLKPDVEQAMLAPQQTGLITDWASELYSDETLTTAIGPLLNGTDPIGLAGTGGGTEDGKGTSFFGVPTDGKTFVFVVDSSKSMNHPHPGKAKTRFRKLKLELVKAIRQMKPEMKFHIIFFNDQPLPMPASQPQSAHPKSAHKYVQWLAQVPAAGKTDPRIAMRRAVAMKPDVIYFLTDGEFESWISSDLKRIKQNSTTIHTLIFGSREGEKVMKQIASANGGNYYYIP